MYRIVRREDMAHGTIVLNEIEAPQIAKKAKPGQFVMIIANETGERIPLTMAEVDKDKGTITIIYMKVGKSTKLFGSLQVGEGYKDVVGPLGQPTHIEKVGTSSGRGVRERQLHPITRGINKQVQHILLRERLYV